jgi:ribonuclease Z
MGVTITVLGSGNPLPDPNRAGAATLVQAGGTRLLIDAGRGVLMRLAGAGVLPIGLEAVLLTHLHSDHITDLNDVITTRWVMSPARSPLHIYGPRGTQRVVDGILAMLAPDISYRLAHHQDLTWEPPVEVRELAGTEDLRIGDAAISVRATDHRPVEPAVGYRISHGGRSAVVAGDTVPCSGLDELCAGAHAYVQTVIRADLVKQIPNQRLNDILDYHSTVEQAAATAAKGSVEKLVCTHFVPGIFPGQEDEWSTLATAHFAGIVVLASDGTVVEA